MMLYLVTGGAGFIGSNIVKKLVNNGLNVRVLDNLSTGDLSKLHGYTEKLEFVEGDITVPDPRVFEDVDVVLHQAAISSVERSVRDPAETEYNNVLGTVNVLKRAAEAGVKRVVMAGSAAIYGDSGADVISEDIQGMPLSPYAISKYACEFYCKSFYNLYGLQTVVLRYFNVFGPYQDPGSDYSGVISKFIEKMSGGEQPVIYGDGEQTRDFVFVEDVAAANLLAASSQQVGSGEVINIGRGKSISIVELVDMINAVLGKDLKPVFAEPRKGDVRHSLSDISRAGKLLGFKPEFDFEEGLRRTVEWVNKL